MKMQRRRDLILLKDANSTYTSLLGGKKTLHNIYNLTSWYFL